VLARSRYNFDRSREFIPGYKAIGGHWRSVAPKALTEAGGERHGVQTISEIEIYHGAGFQLRADARFAHRSGAKVGVRV
jgi:kynureninase